MSMPRSPCTTTNPTATTREQQAQKQEIEADAFALEVMGVPSAWCSLGMMYFFLIASRLQLTPFDLPSAAEYENYLHQRATHPVSAMRTLEDPQTNIRVILMRSCDQRKIVGLPS